MTFLWLFFLLSFFKIKSAPYNTECPGTHYVAQPSFRFMLILSLSSTKITGMSHHTQFLNGETVAPNFSKAAIRSHSHSNFVRFESL